MENIVIRSKLDAMATPDLAQSRVAVVAVTNLNICRGAVVFGEGGSEVLQLFISSACSHIEIAIIPSHAQVYMYIS